MNAIVNVARNLLVIVTIGVLMLTSCGGNESATPVTYTISVTVSGLNGSGMVLQNNAGNNLAVASNGLKTFAAGLSSGAGYAVTLLTAPSAPAQTCTLTNATGTVAAAHITNITVTCRNVVHAYVANKGSDTVSVFTVDNTT